MRSDRMVWRAKDIVLVAERMIHCYLTLQRVSKQDMLFAKVLVVAVCLSGSMEDEKECSWRIVCQ